LLVFVGLGDVGYVFDVCDLGCDFGVGEVYEVCDECGCWLGVDVVGCVDLF